MSTQLTVLRGSGGAPGIAIGAAWSYVVAQDTSHSLNSASDMPTAFSQLAAAQLRVAKRLLSLAEQLRAQGKEEEAAIFDAQEALVQDTALRKRVEERLSAGDALSTAIDSSIDEMSTLLAELDDPYLRERAADVRAIGQMLRSALNGAGNWLDTLPAGAIIVAADLTPAETAELPQDRVAGFATAYGGPTSHTAILARSLGIPAVVGLGADLLTVDSGTALVLDGDARTLTIAPDTVALATAQERQSELHHVREHRQHARTSLGATMDGHKVALWANIGRPEEASVALEAGAEGIGLFRSEFLFLDRRTPPNEDEQMAAYSATLDVMAGRPVVIRTLDIGGDKSLPYLPMPSETNPSLGTRGLRLCMRHPELFRTQLRALLRAALHGDLWVMLPMIATIEDLRWGRRQLTAAAAELTAEGIAHRPDPRLGIMVETPAAVAIADLLARESQFFSIGSNDLAQYTLAADRGASDLAAQYPGDSPAVLRLIGQTAAAARAAGIPVGLCGELGGDPNIAPVLVGLGLDELSMAPTLLPTIKERLANVTLPEAQQQARRACAWET